MSNLSRSKSRSRSHSKNISKRAPSLTDIYELEAILAPHRDYTDESCFKWLKQADQMDPDDPRLYACMRPPPCKKGEKLEKSHGRAYCSGRKLLKPIEEIMFQIEKNQERKQMDVQKTMDMAEDMWKLQKGQKSPVQYDPYMVSEYADLHDMEYDDLSGDEFDDAFHGRRRSFVGKVKSLFDSKPLGDESQLKTVRKKIKDFGKKPEEHLPKMRDDIKQLQRKMEEKEMALAILEAFDRLGKDARSLNKSIDDKKSPGYKIGKSRKGKKSVGKRDKKGKKSLVKKDNKDKKGKKGTK